MDAYEATRTVFSRIQGLDPENSTKIMGLLLLQDAGEKEMIRLAFGPEALLQSVVQKARKDLGLAVGDGAASIVRPISVAHHRPLPPPLAVGSPTWAPPQPFSRANGAVESPEEPQQLSPSTQFYGGSGGGLAGDLVDDLHLHDQLSFLNDVCPKANGELLYQSTGDECWSSDGAVMLPFCVGGAHRRKCFDLCHMGSDPSGFGWKPCLYFARGYCKNGSSCRFLHGFLDDGEKIEAAVDQQCHDLLLMRSKSASARLPFSLTAPFSPSPSSPNKSIDFLLQQHHHQSDCQRTAAALMLGGGGGNEPHKFISRPWFDRTADFTGIASPGSRQIYLTFPADSTFREEDVSNYFSIYGPVQDVRIPYQQKRMFGFVTFVYPETVRLILAKGNPHFVCDARVLVKPYKEKGKVPDKYRKQQGERGEYSGNSTPTGLDARDPFDFQQLIAENPGGRIMYGGGGGAHEAALLRRILEQQQQQQQQAELQQSIELQSRKLMGLNFLDLQNRSLPYHPISSPMKNVEGNPTPAAAAVKSDDAGDHESRAGASNPSEDSSLQGSGGAEHNLPDSPFASPTNPAVVTFFNDSDGGATATAASAAALPSAIDLSSFKSCLFPVPSFSGHGAVGM